MADFFFRAAAADATSSSMGHGETDSWLMGHVLIVDQSRELFMYSPVCGPERAKRVDGDPVDLPVLFTASKRPVRAYGRAFINRGRHLWPIIVGVLDAA